MQKWLIEKRLWPVILSVGLALMLISACATAPEPEPEPEPIPEVVEEPLPEQERELAHNLHQKVLEYEFDVIEPVAFERGVAAKEEGDAAYDVDNEASKNSYLKAIAIFGDILDQGFESTVTHERNRALAAKEEAEQEGAPNAVPQLFSTGMASFETAEDQIAANRHDAGIQSFQDAIEQFIGAKEETLELREQAAEAEEKVLSAKNKAQNEKAAVAARTLFAEAESHLEQGQNRQAEHFYNDAVTHFEQAAETFASAEERAVTRRGEADEALRKSQEILDGTESRIQQEEQELTDELGDDLDEDLEEDL